MIKVLAWPGPVEDLLLACGQSSSTSVASSSYEDANLILSASLRTSLTLITSRDLIS